MQAVLIPCYGYPGRRYAIGNPDRVDISVGGVVVVDDILPRTRTKAVSIVTGAAVEPIVAGTAIQGVIADAPVKGIGTPFANQRIVTAVAIDVVVPAFSIENVVRIIASVVSG
jgi:hypothetical protein